MKHDPENPPRLVPPRGFTLIEMLVVISIITLLISMILPNFGRAKEHAKRLQCAANSRSQVQAADAYSVNNNDYFPPSVGPAGEWLELIETPESR